MKRSVFGVAVMGTLASVLVAGAAVGQGPRTGAAAGQGYGRAAGNGQGYRTGVGQVPNAAALAPRNGQGMGQGFGAGFRGAGGWWNRVTPQTPEQKELVTQVSDLQTRIQNLNRELRTLTLQNAPADQVQARQQEVARLRSQVQQLVAANQQTLQQMGVPAGYGVCDGAGPRGGQGFGRRGGQGMGRGMATGPRNGSGPGRGMRLGPQNGTGPNPYCPLKTQ